MPHLIDLYEEQRAHRDKFEILAFHDATAKNFAELDEKLVNVRAKFWQGRSLPFPILLDSTGATIKAYGINSFPTTLLIDPEGKLVGWATEEKLEKHLPAVPMAERVRRTLDRMMPLNFSETTLEQTCKLLSTRTRVKVHLRQADLDRLHLKADTAVQLNVAAEISLRSWLDLILDPLGLTYEPDDTGLVIVAGARERAVPRSESQPAVARRLERMLDSKIDFDFKNTPLADVAVYFSEKSDEGFALDPWARRAGRLNLQMTVTGSAHNVPLREALAKLLDPVGLTFVIKDEVVVIGPKEQNARAK